jgi:hypothetical protein
MNRTTDHPTYNRNVATKATNSINGLGRKEGNQ